MIELKPCPFCGGKAKLINTGFPPYWVHCETCGAKVNGKTNNKLDSINAWNHRVNEVNMIQNGDNNMAIKNAGTITINY